MTTLTSTPNATTKLARAVGIGVTALCVLVALGVAVLFLALTGASPTGPAPRHHTSGYVTLIPARPTATGIQTMPAHRAERAEGAEGAGP